MKTILTIILLFGVIVVSFIFWANSELNSKSGLAEDLVFTIVPGSSINKAIKEINKNGIFEPFYFYKLYIKYYVNKYNSKLIAGKYKISKDKTKNEIIDALFDQNSLWKVKVTFPEGLSYTKIAEIASKNIGCNFDDFIRLCKNDSLLRAREINAKTLEGYLMPDTYDFFMESTANEVVDVMLDNHFKVKEKLNSENSINELSYHQILTLASIIEAETPSDEEKAIVSGLYHNRLRLGWPMQADPTVQYALGIKRRLTYEDLKIKHPYNTYVISGLPPGPINNPGRKSIESAMNPEKHNFMYMVAVGDGSGKHNFALDFAGHQRNIVIFRKNAR